MKKVLMLLVCIAVAAALILPNALADGGKPACKDGIDNDGDGLVDMDDPGCSTKTDRSETNCGDGVCEGGETEESCPADCVIPDSCSDSDGGDVVDVFGSTSGYYDGQPYSNGDSCVDSANVMEYYCNGNYETSQQQSCGTDGYGAEYCMNSSVVKDYTDYFCLSGACGSTVTQEFVEYCEYGCTNDACNPIPDSCTDSDGGNVVSIFGTTWGHYNEQSYSSADYCVDDANIMEYYCDGDYETSQQQSCGTDGYGAEYCMNSSVVKDHMDYYCQSGVCGSTVTQEFVEYCEYGCTSGACNPIPDSCSDSDGGYMIETQGTVSGYSNENLYNYTDVCNGSAILIEFYCGGSQAYSYPIDCSLNQTMTCIDGACVLL